MSPVNVNLAKYLFIINATVANSNKKLEVVCQVLSSLSQWPYGNNFNCTHRHKTAANTTTKHPHTPNSSQTGTAFMGTTNIALSQVSRQMLVGQVAQAARRLAAFRTVRVRSRVSEGWRFFFRPSCPDWSWGPLNLLLNEYRGISPGVKAAERKTSHPTSS